MGMMPGAGAGAGRKSEGDDEHRSPDYLRGIQPELLVTTPALTGAIGEYPAGDLGDDSVGAPDSAGHTDPSRTIPAPVPSILDTHFESPSTTTASVANRPTGRPVEAETVDTTTASASARSAIELTTPTLPPEIAALLAEHGTQEPPQTPAPAAESERTSR
ncbi:hypothetical protein ACWZHB_23385 [Nocardia sp. FBN12]|uniref:hypothetical protein n=1 Tax=Nocardia sp. FBN12 TaxID=3419766 RepID=UPI003CFD4C80